MGILDFLSGQFIDVIHWTDDTRDTMVSRFEREGHEIKYGAKLTVREGQAAVFVHEGQLADVFTPGLYMLETNNMPIMTSLQHWDHGFKSPFKSEIYFVNTTRFNDLKWGTKNPIIVRDPEFGPVRIALSNIPVMDMAANTRELGKLVSTEISATIAEYGLTIPELYIENVSLPPAVEEVMDKRSSMGVIGDLNKFTQFQAAEALGREGAAGAALQTGLGAGLGMQMGQAAAAQTGPWGPRPAAAAPASHTPPPPPQPDKVWHLAENGQTKGPFSKAALGRMAADGGLKRETYVWTPGQDGWLKADDVAELAQLFTVLPPPPPPAGA